jgi:eukaryotic-like serine/threonine-protein kinase
MSTLHKRARALFRTVMARPAANRALYLASICGDDVALKRAVELLIARYEAEESTVGWMDPDGAPEVTGSESDPFLPGYVFASRYRMVDRIGQGGMGEVWRADDIVLGTPVALKLIHAASRDGRERILNEVRLARQITHPAVCRVFDVGESEGEVFYSMELVKGEDLATLLRRAGRLPPERVRDIGRQLCDGLAAAHGRGVLHRDLKPANILMDENGRVRITDFGIAISRDKTGQHAIFGTPGYMAPEQLAPGSPLSERTDLYALGVVLFELLVGSQPFSDRSNVWGSAPQPSTLPNVDPPLEQVIVQALSPDPRDRPRSATEMAARLAVPPVAERRQQSRPWAAWSLAAASVFLIAAAVWLFTQRGRPLTGQDTIVLADFTNTTGEPVFDGALKVALAVSLEQSPFLKVFPDDGVREELRLMQRAPDERVTRSIAREIARRERLKALVAGSISSLGSHYVVALEAINAETGDVMAREQVEVASKEQVLTALGNATSRLRERLGESLSSIQRFDAPLPRATTSSLEALHAYALALDQGRVVPRVDAIPHLKRAIEIDPNFAMAQALLSGIYANTGRSAEAPAFSRRAFELRDRVSERERFFISWRYYLDAEQAWDKALELSLSWTMTYPREAFAFNSLGLASAAFGQHEQAVAAFREAIRLDSRFVPPYGNLAGSTIALNRFEEAKGLLAEASSRGLDFISLRRMAFLIAFLENDSAAMTRELALVRNTQDAMWASVWEARTAAFAGRLRNAHDLFQSGVEAARRDNLREFAAQWMIEDAETHALADQCPDARRELAAGLETSRDNFTLERASRVRALCGDGQEVSQLSGELTNRFPNATLTTRIQIPVTMAALALKRRQPARTLELLETVRQYDHAPASEFWPAYLRGLAYLQSKDGEGAAAQFRTILDRRGEAPTSPLYPLAHVGLARAAVITGDLDQGRRAYESFLDQWKDADSTLRILEEARQENARLQ